MGEDAGVLSEVARKSFFRDNSFEMRFRIVSTYSMCTDVYMIYAGTHSVPVCICVREMCIYIYIDGYIHIQTYVHI